MAALKNINLFQLAEPNQLCTCCNRRLNPKRSAWLHEGADGKWYDAADVPTHADNDLGWHPFGIRCATHIVDNGGVIPL